MNAIVVVEAVAAHLKKANRFLRRFQAEKKATRLAIKIQSLLQ